MDDRRSCARVLSQSSHINTPVDLQTLKVTSPSATATGPRPVHISDDDDNASSILDSAGVIHKSSETESHCTTSDAIHACLLQPQS